MILESLRLQNFKRYASYEITFESGLYGILGRNGRGKSTIFEGIFFALYGESRTDKKLIPTAGSEGSVKVELNFELEGKNYTAIREFRGKALTAYAALKESDETIVTGAREVSAAITKLLGMGKEAFMHTVFASQKELTALSSMKNDERKGMMRRLLGLEKIDKIEEMIRDELRELNRDLKNASAYLLSDEARQKHTDNKKSKSEFLQTMSTKIAAQNTRAETLKSSHDAAKALVDSHQKAKEERNKKQHSLDQARQTLDLHTKQSMLLDTELQSLQADQTRYTAQLPLKSLLEEVDKSLLAQEELKTRFLKKEGLEKEQEELRKAFVTAKEEVARLSNEIIPLESLRQQLLAEQGELAEHKKLLGAFESRISDLTSQIAADRSAIGKISHQVETITALGRESACPTCTRPLLEHYDSVLSSLHTEIADVYQKRIETLSRDLSTLNAQRNDRLKLHDALFERIRVTDTRIALLQTRTGDLIKSRERFKEIETRGMSNKAALAELGSVTYDEGAHNALREQHRTLKPQVDELIRLEALLATIPAKSEALQALKLQVHHDEATLAAHQSALSADTYSDAAHIDAIAKAKEAETLRETHAAELHRLNLEHLNLRRDIEAIDKELATDDERRSALKTKENDQADYEKLKALMQEFKTHINARVAPRIGEVASEMYSRITRGRYQHIEVSPEFDFYIYDNGERYPIERFSGGEIDLANLVLRISISKTLGELSGGSNIGFLAFDEVFGSQDEERRIQIMEAFHTISESYRQIFLISHETEIKEMFERVVEL
ncbi:MAG: AAA family ATPase [Sulfuricurvum sp.]